jgi:N-acetylglucosaminyldiphosphoundecaprenol N-acetyl-beta-D-mannosaminyltransferase
VNDAPPPLPAPPEFNLLGVRVHAMTIPDLNERIARAVTTRERCIVVSQNLHSVYLVHRDPTLRTMQDRASYVRIDGIPIVYAGRALGYPLRAAHRTGWMDWIDPFMAAARDQGWRVFYVGSKPGVADAGAEILRRRFPGLLLETHHGYFDAAPGAEESRHLVDRVDGFRADVLIVGMGMPRQERWILDHGLRAQAPVILTSGACMDYVAGALPTPPRWLGPIGMEWLHRLVNDPRQMWRRYLVEPWFSVGLLWRDLVTRWRGAR